MSWCQVLILTDSRGTEGEMAEEGLLDPLVIIEIGDVVTSVSESSLTFDHSCDGEPNVKEEERTEDKNKDTRGATLSSEHQKQQSQAKEEEWGEKRAEGSKNADEGQNKCASQEVGQTHEKVNESLEDDEKVAINQLQVNAGCLTSCEQRVEGTKSPEEEAKQVCGPYFCTGPDISRCSL